MRKMLTADDFFQIEMRVGTIIAVADFPKAKKPAYQLQIDFGETLGILASSAQVTALYTKEELIGLQIIAVTNLLPKRVADFTSYVLVLGVPDENENIILLRPQRKVKNGVRVY